MRWGHYSARDHEQGRPYVVIGPEFFARLVNGIMQLSHQRWTWDAEFARRWHQHRQYNAMETMKALAKQNLREPIEFPEMMPIDEAMRVVGGVGQPAGHRPRGGYGYLAQCAGVGVQGSRGTGVTTPPENPKRLPLRPPPPRGPGLGLAAEPPLTLRCVDARLRVRLPARHVVDARAVSVDVPLDAAIARAGRGRGVELSPRRQREGSTNSPRHRSRRGGVRRCLVRVYVATAESLIPPCNRNPRAPRAGG